MNNRGGQLKNKKLQEKGATVSWLPLSRLPDVAAHIDQGVALTERQHHNITERLEVFDDALIARIKKACGDQFKKVLLYGEQVGRWKREELSVEQHFELNEAWQRFARNWAICCLASRSTNCGLLLAVR